MGFPDLASKLHEGFCLCLLFFKPLPLLQVIFWISAGRKWPSTGVKETYQFGCHRLKRVLLNPCDESVL